MFVSCVYPMPVLHAAYFMTCSLLMRIEDGKGKNMKEEILHSRSRDCIIGCAEYSINPDPLLPSKLVYLYKK